MTNLILIRSNANQKLTRARLGLNQESAPVHLKLESSNSDADTVQLESDDAPVVTIYHQIRQILDNLCQACYKITHLK